MPKKHFLSSFKPVVFFLCTLSLFATQAQSQPVKKAGPQQQQPDIYLAGYTRNAQGNVVATYLKNGQPVVLGRQGVESEISCMAVYGNNVYAAGTDEGKPVYWKNGEEFQLVSSDNPGQVYSMTIDERNGDVYIVGYERVKRPNPVASIWTDRARCWKNGKSMQLSLSAGDYHSYANSVAIDDKTGDVYVVGVENNVNIQSMYWKNGGLVSIISDPRLMWPRVIKIVNNDVYILGKYKDRVAYWCGSKGLVIVGQFTGAYMDDVAPSAIAISGNNVYVAARENYVSKFWKNDAVTEMAQPPLAYDNKIAIYGNDVYVGGVGGEPGKPSSKYWKNGELVETFYGDDKIRICDIVVVKAGSNKQSPSSPAGTVAPKEKQQAASPPAPAIVDKPAPNLEDAENMTFLAENKKKPGIITTASGLQYQVLAAGSPDGRKAGTGDKVKYHYSRSVMSGGKIVASFTATNPTTLFIKDLLPGLGEGLMLMNVGSKYKLFLPPKLAYGKNTTGGVPAYSVVIFEVELFEIMGAQ